MGQSLRRCSCFLINAEKGLIPHILGDRQVRKAQENSNETQGLGENSRVMGAVKHTEDVQQQEICLRGIKCRTGSHRAWAGIWLSVHSTQSSSSSWGVTMLQKDQSYKEKPPAPETDYNPENKFHHHANTFWAEFIKYTVCILYIGKLKRNKDFFGFIVKIYFIPLWLPRQAFRWKAVHNTTVFRNEKSETTLTPSVRKKTTA